MRDREFDESFESLEDDQFEDEEYAREAQAEGACARVLSGHVDECPVVLQGRVEEWCTHCQAGG
jgi:hypothetical protein